MSTAADNLNGVDSYNHMQGTPHGAHEGSQSETGTKMAGEIIPLHAPGTYSSNKMQSDLNEAHRSTARNPMPSGDIVKFPSKDSK